MILIYESASKVSEIGIYLGNPGYGVRHFNLDLPRPYSFPELVERLVGIGGEAATGLFRVPATRDGEAIPGYRIEPVHVAEALERYLETGEVYYAL